MTQKNIKIASVSKGPPHPLKWLKKHNELQQIQGAWTPTKDSLTMWPCMA